MLNAKVRNFAFFLLLVFLCFPSYSLGGNDKPIVIIISMDGVRHDAVKNTVLPGFERLMREGTYARALLPVFPSSTFPNHVSLVTGTFADRHGIVGNQFYDRIQGEFSYENDAFWIQAEPLWAACERQSVPSAIFFWVGSEGNWRGYRPTFRRSPFSSEVGEKEKVSQILSWLDRDPEERPRLIMSWWHGNDRAGHHSGPESKESFDALAEQDRHLLQLLEGIDVRNLWSKLTLFIVSDHGMTLSNVMIDPLKILKKQSFKVKVSYGSSVAHAFVEDLKVRDKVVTLWNSLPHVTAYDKKDLPLHLRFRHPDRVGDVIALVEPPARFAPRKVVERGLATLGSLVGRMGGAHGYDPHKFPEMHGIWYAKGRGISPGQVVPPARVVDVAPSAARLLDILPPRHSEGRRIAAFSGEADARIQDREESR